MAEKTPVMVVILFALWLCWLTPIAHAQVTDAQEGCAFAVIFFISLLCMYLCGHFIWKLVLLPIIF